MTAAPSIEPVLKYRELHKYTRGGISLDGGCDMPSQPRLRAIQQRERTTALYTIRLVVIERLGHWKIGFSKLPNALESLDSREEASLSRLPEPEITLLR